jgi:hypothetical protein
MEQNTTTTLLGEFHFDNRTWKVGSKGYANDIFKLIDNLHLLATQIGACTATEVGEDLDYTLRYLWIDSKDEFTGSVFYKQVLKTYKEII